MEKSVKSAINAINRLSQTYAMPSINSPIKSGWQQLIVIGNGFDLECGLKSKYSDFLGPRCEKVYPTAAYLNVQEKTWGNHVRENRITVWDVILDEYCDCLWNDIEKAIETWVVPSANTESSSHFERLLSLLNPGIDSDIPQQDREQFSWRQYVGKKEEDIEEIAIARFILQTHSQKKRRDWDEENLYAYLYNQLRMFENEFNNYLKDQICRNKDYKKRSWDLIRDLSLPGYPSAEDKEPLTTVLNFNYTDLVYAKSPELPMKPINVHGRLDKEIIFGIDGKDLLDNCHVAPFTKTYRLLSLHSANCFTLFESVGDFISINRTLDVIKFYGHSLSAPDYSYFQAIFDEVDLYAGNTRLIFYYRKHSGTKDARAETSKAVSRLLAEYGRTMDNVDHGKNLMHKLILEGRLSVLELKKAQQ